MRRGKRIDGGKKKMMWGDTNSEGRPRPSTKSSISAPSIILGTGAIKKAREQYL